MLLTWLDVQFSPLANNFNNIFLNWPLHWRTGDEFPAFANIQSLAPNYVNLLIVASKFVYLVPKAPK